ncbi:hypothetical protein [Qingshengfaniella alkalisoli]|uniref:SGNH/GDSL hydrolase family protein n=1 Tax=Qingshengfaniella alkalisoli TaxID=2599296 RepID=A0A5B8IA68_9RHOB|nr:hypothetical protein [Qingshengfaniella alkalisoli]QDY70959.1 hypothetical protein FPZ52_14790 [Qingshengfaniella alkalisoli]
MTRIRFLLLTFLGIVVGIAGLVALPHNRYWRFQEHQLADTRKADWIYERLNFDDTPVDIALIGTSRMAGGISGPQIERDYCRLTGRRVNVANLAMPQFGRNMDYIMVKELLDTKSPGLIMLQATEVEGRRPHPGFLTLADVSDILRAPMLINLGWPADISSLPGRQLAMAIDTLRGQAPVRRVFDPDVYAGPDMDRTKGITLTDGTFEARDVVRSKTELDEEAKRRRWMMSRTYLLPGPLRPLEYRLSRVYLNRIYDMADRRDVSVGFAYMPGYTFVRDLPAHIAGLIGDHRVLPINSELVEDHRMWLDVNHVNTFGARHSTARLSEGIAKNWPELGEPARSCPES